MRVGDFVLKRTIGEGAFGYAYYAEHHLLGPDFPACVKKEKTQREPFVSMFREEARLLAKLTHFSLPTLLTYMEEGGDIGQVMVQSLARGKPLLEVAAQGFVDDEHILWIMDRILGALSYLHGRWEIVHGDLKPGNALIDIPDHQVTLVDLGMAVCSPDEFTRAKGGTPGYIPPEFELGMPPIPASDIYSVGKIGVFLAGGNVEQGTTPLDMDPRIASLLGEMIRRDPTERPQEADALRDRISELRYQVFARCACLEELKRR